MAQRPEPDLLDSMQGPVVSWRKPREVDGKMIQTVEALSPHVGLTLDGQRVMILDQSQLPNREIYL